MALTPKQQAFVDEYVFDKNATRAAIAAGYSRHSAYSIGQENLTKPEIQQAIQERLSQLADAAGVKAEEVIRELKLLAFSDLGEVFDFSGAKAGWLRLRPGKDITPQVRRCISAVKVRRVVEGKADKAREVEIMEFRLWPKLEALIALAKHLGLIKDQHEHTYTGAVPVSPADAEAGRAKVEDYLKQRRSGDAQPPQP